MSDGQELAERKCAEAREAGRPVVIGLCGGVASGKSTTARAFADLGAAVVDADKVGHEALEDTSVKDLVARVFTDGIFRPDGSVDRKRLAEVVFRDPARRRDLEAITHPWIRAQIQTRLRDLIAKRQHPAVVLDVSLLLESGAYGDQIDLLVFVDAPDAARQMRAERDRAWDSTEVVRRESHQLSIAEKRRLSDVVIENHGAPTELLEAVGKLWKKFVQGL
jgi:dephospho-CoA kinase